MNQRTVLLVDDDENLLHGLARSLRKQPYRLYTAHSGEEAVWALKTHDMDVIVADQKMPGMSGIRLLAWVAENYSRTIRILLTGHADTDIAIRAVNEGAVYRLLTKPCNEFHLAVTLCDALDYKEQIEQNQRLSDRAEQHGTVLRRFRRNLEILERVIQRDLRKPLCAVSDSLGSAAGQYREVFDPKAKGLIDDALDAAAEMQRLVTRLLESSRADVPTSRSHGLGARQEGKKESGKRGQAPCGKQ